MKFEHEILEDSIIKGRVTNEDRMQEEHLHYSLGVNYGYFLLVSSCCRENA